MVAVDHKLFGQIREHALLRGGDDAGLAMHQLLRPDDVAAKRRTNALMPETNAQDGQLAGKVPNRLDRNTRLCRRTRAGRHNKPVGLVRFNVGDGDLVVAKGLHLGAEFTKVLDDVVGKTVVVVDHQNFHDIHSNPSSTSSDARNSARALASVSFHSSSATESATTPAAACTYSTWSLMMPVRMVMATSMSPE